MGVLGPNTSAGPVIRRVVRAAPNEPFSLAGLQVGKLHHGERICLRGDGCAMDALRKHNSYRLGICLAHVMLPVALHLTLLFIV